MGNLGRYQDFTTTAAKFGGVDKLIKAIEENAVAKSAPRIIAKTVGVTIAVAGIGVAAIKRYSGRRRSLAMQATEAKEHLTAAADDSTILDEAAGSDPEP